MKLRELKYLRLLFGSANPSFLCARAFVDSDYLCSDLYLMDVVWGAVCFSGQSLTLWYVYFCSVFGSFDAPVNFLTGT